MVVKQIQGLHAPDCSYYVTLTDGEGNLVTGVGGGGSSNFLDLTDTPDSYVGEGLNVVRVNAGETALEFFTLGAGSGDVVGPASAVNNNVVFFDGVTGKIIKDSGLTLSGSNTGDETAAGLLTKLLTVDGAGSLLDADLLDGLSSAAFATAAHTHVAADITDFETAAESAIDTLVNLTSIQGFTVTFADASFDVVSGWDDSASAHKNFLLADILTEAAPATGDFFLIYGAEGDLRKVNWSSLPFVVPGGSDTQVQFNDGGSFGGDANFVWDKTSNILSVIGTVELGHASDTTLSRSAAGVLAVEGVSLIRGSVGSTDNAVPRADGTGGSLVQSSGVTISDNDTLSVPLDLHLGPFAPELHGTSQAAIAVAWEGQDRPLLNAHVYGNHADALVLMTKTRGDDPSDLAPAVAGGDSLLDFRFFGSDGTDYVESASIVINVGGVGPSAGLVPSFMNFFTTNPNGGLGPTKRFLINFDSVSCIANDLNENGLTRALSVQHMLRTTETPAVGLAAGLNFAVRVQNSPSEENADMGAIDCVSTDLTLGNEDAYMTLSVVSSGVLSESLRLLPTLGQITINSIKHTASDAGFDVVYGWDDSASTYKSLLLADITAETTPASGDFFLMYGAEGDLRKVDFDDMPAGGAGTGDVVGPASSSDNAVVRFDSTTGKLIQDSVNGPFVTDAGLMRVGGGTTVGAFDGATPRLVISHNVTSVNQWGFRTAGYGTNQFSGATVFTKTRHASDPDGVGALLNGDDILQFDAYGHNGTDFKWAGFFQIEATGDFATDPSTQLRMGVWEPSVSSPQVRMVLSPSGYVMATYRTALTNATVSTLKLEHHTVSTPATGMGVGMDFDVETSAGNFETIAQIQSFTTDGSAGSEDADLVINLMAGGATAAERFRVLSVAGQFSVNSIKHTASDAGFDVVYGWDDSASTYKSMLLADITAEAAPASGDFFLLYGAEGDLRKVDVDDMPAGGGSIAPLVIEDANTVAQRNSTNAQTFQVYKTFTDASNYERLALTSSAGQVELRAETAGTGADAVGIKLTSAGGANIRLASDVTDFYVSDGFLQYYENSGKKFMVSGASGLGLYLSSDMLLGWNSTANLDGGAIDIGMSRNAVGIVEVNNGTAGTYRDIRARGYHGPGQEVVVTLTDGATPALDASLGRTFKLIATGNQTIAVPTNAPAAGFTQKIVIIHEASGGARTLALNTGAGGFRFGTDITALTATTSGAMDYIGCIWNQADGFWDVVSYVKGF